MGLTNNKNYVSGRYPVGTQNEITIGDGVVSSGQYDAPGGVLTNTLPNAVSDLKSTGGNIIILPGTYSLSANLDLSKDNIVIMGSGYSTKIDTGAFYIHFRDTTPDDVQNLVIKSARWTTTNGPILVFGELFVGSEVQTTMVLDNWFEPSSTPPANPNPGTPVPTERFQLDDNVGPTFSGPFVGNTLGNNARVANTSDLLTSIPIGIAAGEIGYTGDYAVTFNGINTVLWLSDNGTYPPGTAALYNPLPQAAATSCTIEAIIFPTVLANGVIVAQSRSTSGTIGHRLLFNSSGNIFYRISSSSGNLIESSVTTPLSFNTKYVITAVYDAAGTIGVDPTTDRLRIYVDGRLGSGLTTQTGTFTGTWTGTAATIGAACDATNPAIATGANNVNRTTRHNTFFTGSIDNVSFFSTTALTAAQVRDRYFSLAPTIDVWQDNVSGFLTNGNISYTTISGL